MSTRTSKSTKREFVYPNVKDIMKNVKVKLEELEKQQQINNSPYKKALSLAQKYKGYDSEQLEELMMKMSYHETGFTMSPTQYQSNDKNKPGKGLFQYEADSLKTAFTRVQEQSKRWGEELPEWFEEYKDVRDATLLPGEIQKSIAVYDLLQRPNFTITNALKGDKELVEEWGKGWQTKSDPEKMNKFETEDLPLYYENREDILNKWNNNN